MAPSDSPAARHATRGTVLALGAAILFGLVSVAAKGVHLNAIAKGAIAYLLAGLVLAITLRGVRVERKDWPTIVAMSLVGGAIAPALLFFGLDQVTVVTASLLLTLEMVFTAILATLFLHERTRGRALVGLALLFLAAILASVPTGANAGRNTIMGVLLVASAALGWGVDNTISAKLVGSYKPHNLVALKGLIGGGSALIVALLLRSSFTMDAGEAARVAFIGLLGVGASIVLFYHALSHIGATRTSAIFLPTSAVAGVLGGRILLGEPIGWTHVAAAVLIVAGILLSLPSNEPSASLAGGEST